MTRPQAYANLLERSAQLADVSNATQLLGWDQETMMPRKGAPSRAAQLATLAGVAHGLLTAPEVGDWLAVCEEDPDLDGTERAQVRELRRDYDKATRLPRVLVEEMARTESEALAVWRDARPARDFAAFAPYLARLLDLTRRKAEAYGYANEPYDALLDEYERGMTTEVVRRLFDDLRARLTPLVSTVLERRGTVSSACVRQDLPEAAQAAFGLDVIRELGFDLEAGRVDVSAHPFCASAGHGDTRLTRRYLPDDLRPALYGIIHEAGHGLYEQGLPIEWDRTPLGAAASLGVHESQSRLWENIVGRSLPFCERVLPRLQTHFPGRFDATDAETLYRAVNEVELSLIRVEADELTYNLHVMLRFDLEVALLREELAVKDLPRAWNEATERLLSITPPHDGDGCLQDIHWSMGSFGYFPTYTLGNLYAAQLFDAARRALPDVDALIRRGEFAPLLEWLRANVHRHGRSLAPDALIEQATGRAPSAEPFFAYLQGKFGGIYNV